MVDDRSKTVGSENDVAIVGMAAHLPGSSTLAEYWANLRGGVESIKRLSREELLEAGEEPGRLHHKNYVPASAMLDGYKMFDADFFGFSPKEAAIMDPQHRKFLETSWEAFENAGHPPENFDGRIGVYAGCGMGSYFYFNVCSNPDLVENTGMFLLRHTGNDKDFMATRLSHILNLTGPSINLQTACSTSLVATHYACQALLTGECDMALAGGVTIELPQGRGYIFEDGEILSPDGHCHAFDHRAEGTVFGSGAGVVVLRRLTDALADGDHIWGVVKGSAVNNDGSAKAGYLAPSVDGQAEAIAEAHAMAGVSAETIDYVECHGTGTYLGDPIEIAALTEAFSQTTDQTGYCDIGSVKTNIGHLDTAAGVASLIKTTLALHNQQIPPSLGYENPNPAIDFENSPFVVNSALKAWESRQGPRRAGVNSLGVGGTNAHVIVEEAPERGASEESDWPFQLLTVSGRSKAALEANTKALTAQLRANPDLPLADVAFTLKEGRRAFEKRRVVVAETAAEAADLLAENNSRQVFTHTPVGDDPDVVFMFPGGGAQYAGMAQDLYETEPVFQEWMDRGLEILQPKLDYDIRALWLPEEKDQATARQRLKKPSVQLPLIMIVEYALAQLWVSWGVKPSVLVGHSMGENTAACLAGVLSFEDCIGLVHLRGTLFDTVPAGGMLSVPLPVEKVRALLCDDLDLASINAPELSAVSGPDAALDRVQAELAERGIECQRIPIDIAAHSRMLEPILEQFGDYLRSISLSEPKIPFVSNRSGGGITDAEATDPEYWVGHLRNTVNFADCISTLSETKDRVFLEVGPGKALSSLTQMHPEVSPNQVLSSLRHPDEVVADDQYFLSVLGRFWATGVEFDWQQIWGEARRQRVVLPTYAFQRSAYFIEPRESSEPKVSNFLTRTEDPAKWGYRPVWRPQLADCILDVEQELDQAERQTWLILMDDIGIGARVAGRLRDAGQTVVEVRTGDSFGRDGDMRYVIAPERGREGFDLLIRELVGRGMVPNRIANLWLVTQTETFRPGSSLFHRNQEQGFYALMFLAQAIGDENLPMPIHITCVTSGAAQVRGETLPYPEKATVAGPLRVIPQELPGMSCAALDVEIPESGKRGVRAEAIDGLATKVLEDLMAPPRDYTAALRGDKRFELDFKATELPTSKMGDMPVFRDGGVYLITGGFGGIGLTLAREMIQKHNAKVVLVARSALPARVAWEGYLKQHGPQDEVAQRIRAVQELEALGGSVMNAAADACNLQDMQKVVNEAQARFGAVNGVVHAAGVVDDGLLLAKNSADVEEVLAPKIHGTQVLQKLFPDGTLDWLVLFSSTSTAIAPAGQIDYVAANEYLNAYAQSRRGDRTRVVAVNWGIWNEVGMAAQAVAERTGEYEPAPSRPISAPLLDEATFGRDGSRLLTATYNTQDRWLLDQHRTKAGEAILPGTGYLELAAEALQANGETSGFEIRNLLFLRALQVQDGEARDIQVRLERTNAGYGFEVLSGCTLDGRKGYQLNAQADIVMAAPTSAEVVDPGVVFARCAEAACGEGLRSPQEAHLNFGSRWRVLRRTAYGDGEGIAELALPDQHRADTAKGYLLHPALLDLATGWAMQLIAGYQPTHLWVPVSYDRVQVIRPLPAEVFSWVRNASENSAESSVASFDVTICDAKGDICLEVKDFAIKRLETGSGLAQAPRLTAGEMRFDDEGADQPPLSTAEERLQHNLTQGIRPEEGVVGFISAVSSGLPQVFVSSLDLRALQKQAAAASSEQQGSGQMFERPELDSDYTEPSNDIERTLVGFWSELLGVQQVGVTDSFFDLGGHSLIAVRLFAKVKKAYRIEFPISVLFEAPTIQKCAELIAEKVGPVTEGEAPVSEGRKTEERRYTHLVAMHQGEGGPKTPFFLMAGMFGNVLNLRHLAHLLGADRPFYGLQARGLYGDAEPHTCLREAAADYIAEMRTVQPRGPYLLGGFSGGGITAYEIAQQLEAAGEKVSLLVMLDTPLPRRRALSRKDRMIIHWLELKKAGPAYPIRWAANRIKWELNKRKPTVEVEDAGHQFHDTAIEAAFLQSVETYQLKPWNGPLVLVRPPLVGKWQVSEGRWIDSQRAYVFEDNDWSGWVPGIQVLEVSGDHDSMVLEPNVRVLAARMKASIEAAERAAGSGHRHNPDGAFAKAAE
ncbi:MAG: SDR family NAD(P)-dependent oxidoreductase [Rhodobacteraceae bacterium]|nr:SDR family NAD(P)-dependent oxidoreductase [Paracoccaceae bacterium]